ncbi:MAG: 3-oxoacyl-ACP synthase [Bacteroidetes bacterium]|nr:3-oxoacyl-ACP synthase [Bacteroidota bacterium]
MSCLITCYSLTRNGVVIVNGDTVYSDHNTNNPAEFLNASFRHSRVKYPKFFKMDNLCKLAFSAAERMLLNAGLKERYPGERIAIVMQNAASTVDVDTRYWETVSDKRNYFPNPALFVYTLPNIMIGEICIKNQIKGENCLFVFDKFDPCFLFDYTSGLLESGRADAVISGWVNFDSPDYEAFLLLVEKEESAVCRIAPFTKEKTEKLYLSTED